MSEKFSQKKQLKTYQCDRFGNMRPVMLMNELQAVADTHADMLGAGRAYCMEHGIAWVVTHYLIDIIESPRETEELEFITWPAAHDELKAVRDFEVRGMDGRLLVRATSQWILINTTTRRPLRLSENLPFWSVVPQRAYDRTFDKFAMHDAQFTMHNFNCRYDDVDVNQHINNAVYAVWATESVSFEFQNSHRLTRLEINFKKEIPANTPMIAVAVAIDGLISHHTIKTGDTVNADVICEWAIPTHNSN
ncbi:MAG: hypothetical protein LBO08_02695 [Rickettsiales bacterium]|jgi:medium-chain acyl-[acyl-carrier-protein] hydrolase|nr:hypothetical protein [Rickettsiales bacterium]